MISSTARRPPGRRTRHNSASPRSRSSRFRTPKPTVAASNSPSRNGSASASPCTQSIVPDLRRARSSMRSEKSSPVTRPPRRSASTARSPVPQHASRTRSPGHTTLLTASRRQRRSSPTVMTRFIASYTGAIRSNMPRTSSDASVPDSYDFAGLPVLIADPTGLTACWARRSGRGNARRRSRRGRRSTRGRGRSRAPRRARSHRRR